MKPTIIANYNKAVNKFNSLIGELQNDIAKRDKIYQIQKRQGFLKENVVETTREVSKEILFGTKETGWEERMRMGEIPEYKLSSFVSKADESDIKDVKDAFILGGSRIWQQSKDYFLNVLPHTIFAPISKDRFYKMDMPENMRRENVRQGINAENKKRLEYYDKGYARSQALYYKWIED
ncbi:unnamed protein product, partial [marine sediment metagenome]